MHAVFRYFIVEGYGRSRLTPARTKENSNDFLNWLKEEIKGITDEDEVWKEVTVEQANSKYREVRKQASTT